MGEGDSDMGQPRRQSRSFSFSPYTCTSESVTRSVSNPVSKYILYLSVSRGGEQNRREPQPPLSFFLSWQTRFVVFIYFYVMICI